MTIPTSRENSTRALSTADLAAASRQSPREGSVPDDLQEAEQERSVRVREAGQLDREELVASQRDVADTDVRRGDEIEYRRDNEMRSVSLRPGELGREEMSPGAPAGSPHDELLEPLFVAEQAESYRKRWIAIQSSFVDDPSGAVRAGDELVAQVMSELANSFAEQRRRIESQIGNSRASNTEDLRVALKSYRSFFERLLSL